ncbi:MAG: autotransporter domain-containing protein, partial [Planctomycetes bacterium]|nr:autotransporter domain-containing protein [Planctomycetota bacterium]
MTDAQSTWTSDVIIVGMFGDGTLNVNNGGGVTTWQTWAGVAPEVTGTINVSDAALAANQALALGIWGEGRATIDEGGTVTAAEAYIGGVPFALLEKEVDAEFTPDGTGTVTVKKDSALEVAGTAFIGYTGTGTVNVDAGGRVEALQAALGVAPGSSGTVVVDGAQARFNVVVDEEGTFEDETGRMSGVLIVGGYGDGGMTVENGGQVNVDDVVWIGGYMLGDLPFAGTIEGIPIGPIPDGTGVVTVTGENSALNTNALVVGFNGQGTLQVLNDATVTSNMALIGVLADGEGSVLVDDAADSWVNTGSVAVGAYGQGNVNVQNGGHVQIGEVLFIGGYATDFFFDEDEEEEEEDGTFGYGFGPNGVGVVEVTGVDSLLEAGGIGVGVGGDGTLRILNGAEVQTKGAAVGLNGVGRVIVDGQADAEQPSTWRIASPEGLGLGVPDLEGEGSVTVSNGGRVIVDGQGFLAVADDITVGSEGTGNTLTISNGGTVFSGDGFIGGRLTFEELDDEDETEVVTFQAGAGAATVTDAGSVWNTWALVVGVEGDGTGEEANGTLEISAGGQVNSHLGIVGLGMDSIGAVTVGGEESAWNVTTFEGDEGDDEDADEMGLLMVGVWGQGNLTIQADGVVNAATVYIGGVDPDVFGDNIDWGLDDPTGTGTVTVTGTNARLNVTGLDTLYVGYSGTGTLNVENDGQVDAPTVVIGAAPGADGTVTVDGELSEMSIANELIVGVWGEGRMTISNEGTVEASTVYIGGYDVTQITDLDEDTLEELGEADGIGTVTVTREGSRLTVGGLLVGFSGEGTLEIRQDATVTSDTTFVGVLTGAQGEILVDNAADSWVNTGSAVIGAYGEGTLTVQNGGHADIGEILFIGGYSPNEFGDETFGNVDDPDGTGTVLVTGTGSLLQALGIGVGVGGDGTLEIRNGAEVQAEGAAVGLNGVGRVIVDGQADAEQPSTWRIASPEGLGLGVPDLEGEGSVTVSNGGRVIVDGLGFLAVADEITVGSEGTGNTLTISNGGSVTSGWAVLGGTDPDFEGIREYLDNLDTLGTGTGTATITGAASTWRTGEILVGMSGTGILEVTDGQVASEMGWLGILPGAAGTATISGPTASWINDETLAVGMWGQATLRIENGALGRAPEVAIGGVPLEFLDEPFDPELLADGTGTVIVTGPGSRLDVTGDETLYVGYSGTGTLRIDQRGRVDTTAAVLGGAPDAVGEIRVQDDGSLLSVDWDTIVGAWGTGYLSVSDDGRATTGPLSLGGFDTEMAGVQEIVDEFGPPLGTGVVNVFHGGQLEVSGPLHVGYLGTGSMSVGPGGYVTSNSPGTAYIGYGAGSTGTVHVYGDYATHQNATWDEAGPLHVGYEGHGVLGISTGGRVNSQEGFIGSTETGSGVVDVWNPESIWQVAQDLYVGGDAEGAKGTGVLNVGNAAVVAVGDSLTVWQTGTLAGDGQIVVGDGEGQGLRNYGTIAPGNSIGTTSVDGNVIFEEGSTYAVEISNTGSDRLVVEGDVTINGGTVQVSAVGTVVGAHEYEIITAQSVTGEFEALDTALLTFSFSDEGLIYDETSVWLQIVAANFDDPSIVRTPNQGQLGGALQQIADEGANEITDALQDLVDPEDLRQAYDLLAGLSRPPLAPVATGDVSRFLGTVSGRVQTLHTGVASGASGSSLFAMSGPDSSLMSSNRMADFAAPGQSVAVGNGSSLLGGESWGLWGRGYGLFGDRETEFEAPGYSYKMYGGSVGLDYQFTPGFLGGVVAGLADGDVDFSGLRDNADLQAWHIGLYGSLTSGRWYLDSVATYADLQFDTERFVDLLGERLTGDQDGYAVAAYVETGFNCDLAANLVLQPLASFQYT